MPIENLFGNYYIAALKAGNYSDCQPLFIKTKIINPQK